MAVACFHIKNGVLKPKERENDSLIERVFNSVYKANYGLYLRIKNIIWNRKNKYGKEPENGVSPDIPLIYGRVTVVAMGRVLIYIRGT